MASVFVIADDYTGALDTGAQFAASGASVYVTTIDNITDADAPDLFDQACDYDVYVVDAESRHLPPNLAAGRVRMLAWAAFQLGFSYYYKKTDSALRGNIGAELAAMIEANGDASLAFVPAYPKSARVTINGIQYIGGIPLAESVFAQDPHSPVKYSRIESIILEQAPICTISIPASCYALCCNKNAAENNDEILTRCKNENTGAKASKIIEIYDAQSDDDLASLGKYLKSNKKLRSLAGCAGFASVLPELYGIGKYAAKTPHQYCHDDKMINPKNPIYIGDSNVFSKSMLLITGSVNPITFQQLAKAEDAGFKTIILTPEQKLSCLSTKPTVSTVSATEVIAGALREHGRVIVAAAMNQSDVNDTDSYARKHGIPGSDLRKRICENIGEIATSLIKQYHVGTLAVFGGDTLYEIIRQAKISAISPIRELAPGIVESKILTETYAERLISKSGGLGSINSLQIICDRGDGTFL